jgi:serine/threonine protein phosphatase 1
MWNLLFRGERKNRLARVPDGFRLYAVGDVHGRADLLKQLLSVIDADVAVRPIARPIRIFLGDYVDRGPESKEVLDVLVEYGERHEVVFLKGNHETYVFEFLKTPEILAEWRQFGGTETLPTFRPHRCDVQHTFFDSAGGG